MNLRGAIAVRKKSYALSIGSVRVEGAAAVGPNGSWWVRNTAAAPVTAQLQTTCARVS